MKWLEQLRFYLLRFVIFMLFFSFYLIMIAVNIDRIEDIFDPLSPWKGAVEKVESGLYIGAYPNAQELQRLQKDYGVQRVISLLDPNFPVSRELLTYEKRNCKKYGIIFVSLSQHDLSDHRNMATVITEILAHKKVPTYIHYYFINRDIKQLSAALLYGERQTLQKQGSELHVKEDHQGVWEHHKN